MLLRTQGLTKTYHMANVVGSELGFRQQIRSTKMESAYLDLVTFFCSSCRSRHDACVIHQDILLMISGSAFPW